MDDIESWLSSCFDQRCCRKRVGRGRSLSVGFGKMIPNGNRDSIDSYYGEWEIGTYSSGWRITRDGKILCGSAETVDSIAELDAMVQEIDFGRFQRLKQTSDFDIRIEMTERLILDFFCLSSEDDSILQVFLPTKRYAEFLGPGGWKFGKSNEPLL